jgi:hypothetical protein
MNIEFFLKINIEDKIKFEGFCFVLILSADNKVIAPHMKKGVVYSYAYNNTVTSTS